MDEMPGDNAVKALFRAINEINARKSGAAAEAREHLNDAVAQHGLNRAALLECIRLAKWSKSRRDDYRRHRDHYFTLLGLDADGDVEPRRSRRKAEQPQEQALTT
jgi:hypothetical protein